MNRFGDIDLNKIIGNLSNASKAPKPLILDSDAVTPDNLHNMGLIKKGESRYIIAGEFPCSCAHGRIFKRVGSTPNAYPCPNCYHVVQGIRRIQRAHLPNDAYDANLNDYIYDSERQSMIVIDMLSCTKPQLPPSLFMHGKPGNGKSTISYILARHLCMTGYKVKYLHHHDAFQKEKSTWGTNREYLNKIVDGVDVLIFDEFGGLGGRSKYSEWFTTTTIELTKILYEKYKAGQLSIILMSNLTPKQIFKDLLDRNDAALSRLESMFGIPLEMMGPDRRPKRDQVSKWV